MLTSDENSLLLFSTPDTVPLASACSCAVLVSDPVVPVTVPASARHRPAAVCGMLAGEAEADADADGVAVCCGTVPAGVPEADGDGDAEPGPDDGASVEVQPGTEGTGRRCSSGWGPGTNPRRCRCWRLARRRRRR